MSFKRKMHTLSIHVLKPDTGATRSKKAVWISDYVDLCNVETNFAGESKFGASIPKPFFFSRDWVFTSPAVHPSHVTAYRDRSMWNEYWRRRVSERVWGRDSWVKRLRPDSPVFPWLAYPGHGTQPVSPVHPPSTRSPSTRCCPEKIRICLHLPHPPSTKNLTFL